MNEVWLVVFRGMSPKEIEVYVTEHGADERVAWLNEQEKDLDYKSYYYSIRADVYGG